MNFETGQSLIKIGPFHCVRNVGTYMLIMKQKMPGFISKQVSDRSKAIGQQVLDTAENIRTVAHQLRNDAVTEKAAELADVAATTAEQVGNYFTSSDLDTMVSDAEAFSRKRPLSVIVGGLILGLGASRVLKAGDARRSVQTEYANAGR